MPTQSLMSHIYTFTHRLLINLKYQSTKCLLTNEWMKICVVSYNGILLSNEKKMSTDNVTF